MSVASVNRVVALLHGYSKIDSLSPCLQRLINDGKSILWLANWLRNSPGFSNRWGRLTLSWALFRRRSETAGQ